MAELEERLSGMCCHLQRDEKEREVWQILVKSKIKTHYANTDVQSESVKGLVKLSAVGMAAAERSAVQDCTFYE